METAFRQAEDEVQARILVDQETRRYFLPFLGREATISEAAAEVDCKPSAMLYRVGTFVRAGLLEVVREEPRAGRAIKVYRSTADAYFVPYSLTPFATLEEGFRRHYEANARLIAKSLARVFTERGWDGYRIFRADDGQPWMIGAPVSSGLLQDPLEDSGLPPGTDYSAEVYLDRSQARALSEELNGLLTRYRQPAQVDPTGTDKYFLSTILLPLVDERGE